MQTNQNIATIDVYFWADIWKSFPNYRGSWYATRLSSGTLVIPNVC